MFKFNFMRVSKVLLVVVIVVGLLGGVYRIGYVNGANFIAEQAVEVIKNIMSQCNPVKSFYTQENDQGIF